MFPFRDLLAALVAFVLVGGALFGAVLQVDFARTNGAIRALHGINKGPLVAGGMIDLTEPNRALGIPFARLHDCHWPNPDVVDVHAIFPNFAADPSRPESYDFALTDEYLAAIRATGAQIIFRLGESIEHTKTKRFVHPPEDFAKWTEICLGIIRHYNEGWANGFRHGIRHWEIWNEPENRPAMWSGSDDDYFRLYRVTARAIKARYPTLLVGGPAVGNSGQWSKDRFKPSAFVTNFLEVCRRESLPLDFFSWHCYTDQPQELAARARGVRRVLDAYGFARTESHLNEWNYLPGNSWKGLSKSSTAEAREKFYQQMGGAPGAAFIVAALLELQDAPVDVCNLFHGEAGGFGLFSENGVPLKGYHALRSFRQLLDTPQRVETLGSVPGQAMMGAGLALGADRAAILVSNFRQPDSSFRVEVRNIPWRGETAYEVHVLDGSRDLEMAKCGTNATLGAIDLQLKAPAVALIALRAGVNRN